MTAERLRVAAITHQGHVRERNEDCVAVGQMVFNSSMLAPSFQAVDIEGSLLCMIADGVGGQAAGEVASQYACRRMVELTSGAALDVESLRNAIRQVHTDIYEMMNCNERYVGMGTTVAGLLFSNEACLCFNVGDSRAYRVQSGYLAQLSTDDIAKGRRPGSITQCLGGTATYVEILPHIVLEKFIAGRSYLICSDGLTDMVSIEEVEARLSDEPVRTVEALFSAAMDRGATDNISIICAKYT